MPHSRSHRSHLASGSDPANELTAYGKAAVVLVAAIPMLAMTGYGAVDVWALIPLGLLTAILVVLWTVDSLKKGEVRYSTSLLQIPILGLIAIGCIQLLPLGDPGISNELLGVQPTSALSLDAFATRIFTVRIFLLFIFFGIALSLLKDKKTVQRIVLVIIIFGAVMAFVGILQRLASPDAIYGMRPTPQAIPFGPFVNQHHFAAFMEMTIGLTLAALFGGATKRDKKALFLIALSLMAIAVLMTGSRGGLISMITVTAFVLFTVYAVEHSRSEAIRRQVGLKMAAGAAAVLVIAAAGVLYLSGADPLVRGLGIHGVQGDVTSGRMHFWSIALKIFLENPVIGAGFEAFGVAFTRFDTWNGFFRVEYAHNEYLQILADGGILAFICVAAFVFLLFRRGMNVIRGTTSATRRSIAVGAIAGCLGIFVHSFFDFPLRTWSNSYFFLLLVVLATTPLGDERKAVK